jgi:hypothetical protein
MGKLLVVLAILGVGGYFSYKHFFKKEERSCAKMATLCGDKAGESTKCESDLAELGKVSPEAVAKFHTCIGDANSCGEAAGCYIGAGMKAVGNTLNDVLKGMGKALGQ